MTVKYKGSILTKGSRALELWQEWDKTKTKEAKKKLDDHVKDVERRYKELLK